MNVPNDSRVTSGPSRNYRSELVFLCLLMVFAASVGYDALFFIPRPGLRALLAVAVLAGFAAVVVGTRLPRMAIQQAILAAWPLHLFTLFSLGLVWVAHDGARLGSMVAYTLVAYAAYLMCPLCLLVDRRMLDAFIKLVAVGSALLAIPSFVGAMGIDFVAGIPISNKYSYSSFSGIIASGGIFEHQEGHALQMAVGLFCCLYAWRKSGNVWFAVCLVLTAAGLLISQGRGAIFGVAIAGMFWFLPEIFRRSVPLFLGILVACLVVPFFVWPQMSKIPVFADYLRLERGLSGRDVAWQYALTLTEEKPWVGHGFGSSAELSEDAKKQLRVSGYSGAGTTFHNTFITKAVEFGWVAALVYALLYLVPLIRICRPTRYQLEQQLIRSLIILTLTASVFRDYNVGGVRSTSLMVALFLGLACLWHAVVESGVTSQDPIEGAPLTSRSPGAHPDRSLGMVGQQGG